MSRLAGHPPASPEQSEQARKRLEAEVSKQIPILKTTGAAA
jgi:hypothetical protein